MEHRPVACQEWVAQPLPAAFAARFENLDLASEPSTLVAIDPDGKILWVNHAWHRFAAQNDGAEVLARFGVGAVYFDGISGPLRCHFQDAFRQAWGEQCVFLQDYECSPPSAHGSMRVRALPILHGGLLLEHSCVVETFKSRSAHAMASSYLNEWGLIVQCSNCRRVQRPVGLCWDWIPAWVGSPPSPTSHGICRVCAGFYWAKSPTRPSAVFHDCASEP